MFFIGFSIMLDIVVRTGMFFCYNPHCLDGGLTELSIVINECHNY